MIIALDVDGVLADCSTPVHEAYERVMQRKLRGPAEWHDFDFATSMFLDPDEARSAHEQITREGSVAWRVQLYPGAKDFVQTLQLEHDVYFLTSQWSGMRSWVPAREELLHGAFPGVDIVFTHNKLRARFDLLIDDKPKTVQALPVGKAWMYTQPWNKHVRGVPRVFGFDGALNALTTLPEVEAVCSLVQ